MEVTVNHQFDQALKDAEARGYARGYAIGYARRKAQYEEIRLRRDASIVKRMAAQLQLSPDYVQSFFDAVDRDLQNTPESPQIV